MKTAEVREKYLKFMESKGHAIVPSSGLVPENDPTTLFTGSGMQPLLPYLLGEKHPKGTRIVDSQKCFRAEDIEEVGDNRHTTFFEMLGNWSFGDYFKKEQLPWIFDFLTNEEYGLALDPNKIYVSVFEGDENAGVPKDTEAIEIWRKLFGDMGIDAKEGTRIFAYNAKENWWSRAGVPENMPAGEPGGPDSEMFYEFTSVKHDNAFGERCHPACDCGRFMEIGNSVFMAYQKQVDDTFEELAHKNIDFGGGLERLTAATNNDPDVFKIDIFANKITELEELSGKKYDAKEHQASFRIIADHIRAAEAMIKEDVLPSNTEQGYFTRRLIRRSIIHADKLGIPAGTLSKNTVIVEEEKRFRENLERGKNKFNKFAGAGNISGADAFTLFATYGFPIELTEELAEEKKLSVDRAQFDEEMRKHKDTSRAGAEQKFKGGLADTEGKTIEYHTATHLMLEGLRRELGDGVTQKGSNITGERARFDFTHGEKVGREVLDKVDKFVNDAISAKVDVIVEEMPKEEAKTSGATGAFWEKYPDVVTVYTAKSDDGTIWSRELCGGPHVKNTGDIKGTFKILKEKSISAGVRRVKAVLE